MKLLCLNCRAVAEPEPGASLSRCPSCGDRDIPADLGDTVTLTITTHELRVLTMWASNYAESIKDKLRCGNSPQVIQGILDGISQYTDAPLSLRQEVADVRAAFPESEVTVYKDGAETDI